MQDRRTADVLFVRFRSDVEKGEVRRRYLDPLLCQGRSQGRFTVR